MPFIHIGIDLGPWSDGDADRFAILPAGWPHDAKCEACDALATLNARSPRKLGDGSRVLAADFPGWERSFPVLAGVLLHHRASVHRAKRAAQVLAKAPGGP